MSRKRDFRSNVTKNFTCYHLVMKTYDKIITCIDFEINVTNQSEKHYFERFGVL